MLLTLTPIVHGHWNVTHRAVSQVSHGDEVFVSQMSVPGIIVLGDIFTACFAPDERQAVGVGEVRKLLQEDLDLVLLPQMIEELEGAWKCSEIGAALTSELAAGTPRADRHFDPLVVRVHGPE